MATHGVCKDFDGVATLGDSQWSHIERSGKLPKWAVEESARLRNIYAERAHAGQLTPDDEMAWLYDAVRVYARAGLKREDIRAAAATAQLRPGVGEFMEIMGDHNIPVAIVSNGLCDFISHAFTSRGTTNFFVVATRLRYKKSGSIDKIAKGSEVIPSSKRKHAQMFASQKGILHRNILAIGDSLTDASLATHKDNIFGIARDEAHAEQLRGVMGTVLVTNSFEPVTRWALQRICA